MFYELIHLRALSHTRVQWQNDLPLNPCMRKGTKLIKFIKHSLDKTHFKKLITMTAIDERTYAFMHARPFFNNISPVSQSESESEMFLFDPHKKFLQTCCLSNAPLVARLVGASPFNIVFSLSDCKSKKTVMTQIQP